LLSSSFLLTASKVAGTGFVIEAVMQVIEAVTGVSFLLTVSNGAGIEFVIEAVTGVPVFIDGFESWQVHNL